MTREQDYNEYQRFQAHEAAARRETPRPEALAQEITNDMTLLALGGASVGTLIERPAGPAFREHAPSAEPVAIETRRAAGGIALHEVMRANEQRIPLQDRRTVIGYAAV